MIGQVVLTSGGGGSDSNGGANGNGGSDAAFDGPGVR